MDDVRRKEALQALILLACTVPGIIVVTATLAGSARTMSMAEARAILARPEPWLTGPEPTPFGASTVPYLGLLAITIVGCMSVAAWAHYARSNRLGLFSSLFALSLMFILLPAVSDMGWTHYACVTGTVGGCQTIRYFFGGSDFGHTAFLLALAAVATFVTCAAFLFRLGERRRGSPLHFEYE